MPATISVIATGVSPAFPITAEEFKSRHVQSVTRIGLDGVEPPVLGAGGGKSYAHALINQWFPWIDEKIVEPKYDGIAQYLGLPSNRPTFIKDYHMIALMRAVDRILHPTYVGLIKARTGTVSPNGSPSSGGGST